MNRPFKDPSTAAARRLLSRFGVAATYATAAGVPAPSLSRVWFVQDVRLQVAGYDSTATLKTKTIECIAEDIAGLARDGSFTIAGTAYKIVELLSDDTERLIFQVK